ncbi:MAG: NAD+ synthase [Pseudomonadota bacterium]
MTSQFRIALAQINPTVGAVAENAELIRRSHAEAKAAGADLVVFPELSIAGYPPEDLVLKPAFQGACRNALERLAPLTADGPAMLVGSPWVEDGQLFNAAVLLQGGVVESHRLKHALPNYGVFDEVRVFDQGPIPSPVPFALADGSLLRVGLMVCEDMWVEDVAEALAECGADLLLVMNGSPFDVENVEARLQQAVARITETDLPLAYLNQVGGQDELCFDGASFVLNKDRRLVAQAKTFVEDFLVTDWEACDGGWTCRPGRIETAPEDPNAARYGAMVLALRDYVTKNRFPGVVLGLSGGIDSALSAAVAVDALGPERVHTLMLPSRFTSEASLEDAKACAEALGCRLDDVPIEATVDAIARTLEPLFDGRAPDTTEENVQSRVRGLLLMAISNKLGPMVLTTGNKSEMSVGYATLYGDMCGGYSVLKDAYKTTVFELCRWRNAHRPTDALGPDGPVIPERVIQKPPTAELRDDQKDEDSLPPYPVLDAILHGLVEGERHVGDLIADGQDGDTVRRVVNLLDLAEYKRRQAPPGVKLTAKAFGRDRRYPITNAFRHVRTEP